MKRLLFRMYFGFHLIEQKLFGMLHCQTWLPPTAKFGRGTLLLLALLILLELGFLSFTLGVFAIIVGSREIATLILNNDYTFKVIVIIAYFFLPTMYFIRTIRDKSDVIITSFESFNSESISQKIRWVIISISFFALCTCFTLVSFLWLYHMLNN